MASFWEGQYWFALGEGRTYCCGIICLTKVAVDTACAGGIDDSAIFLLEHIGVGSFGHLVSTTHVDRHDDIPLIVGHVGKCLVPENASIVDQYVDSAEVVDGSFDDSITILNRCLIAHCGTS